MKEKVINTRVSKELYEKISDKAKKYRTTTANLLRNILEDSIDIYTDASDLVDEKIKSWLSASEIIGFQEFTLRADCLCSNCKTNILAGDSAYNAINKGNSRIILCTSCQQKLS
ncbi:MAG: hypothetical protein WCJ58_08410 [bacterium]